MSWLPRAPSGWTAVSSTLPPPTGKCSQDLWTKGTNQKKKHPLRLLAEKVHIHDRRTIEIWYGLPNRTSVSTPGHSAPQMYRSANRQAEPEVYFRIVNAVQGGHDGAPVAAYRDQTVEIALGPKGAFENGNMSALTRQLPVDTIDDFSLDMEKASVKFPD